VIDTREDVQALLRQVDLFARLHDDRVAWLADQAEILHLEPGEVFIRAGEQPEHCYVLAHGALDWFSVDGGVETTTGHMEAVNYAGMTTTLAGDPYQVSARAAGAATLLRFSEATLLELVRAEPEVLREIVRQFRPVLARVEARTRQREKLAALGSLSAGLAHEINNPAAAAGRAAAELARSIDVLRGGAKRLAEMSPEQLAALGQLACRSTHTVAGGDPLDAADREATLTDWLEARGVPEPWELAGELAGAGLDERWAEEIERAVGGERLASVIPWAAAGATTGGLVEELTESLRRVSELVGAIKDYSYADQAAEQELDVHDGLESTVTILAHKLKKGGVSVARDYDRTLPRIVANGGELNQVWTNLIDNAIGAAGPGGKLTLATAREANRIRVTVGDDGPGIPPEIRDRIFDPFFTTKPVGEGTGLGLDVVWRIVTGHGGEVRVVSEPGDTRFEVLLPAP
jgi:signal transduction histidine kinase